MNAPQRLAPSRSRKPPRMRAACSQCHAAKVKCDGDQAGCSRCRDAGLICRYEVSMVGRMSTKRSSRRGRVEQEETQPSSSAMQALYPTDSVSSVLGDALLDDDFAMADLATDDPPGDTETSATTSVEQPSEPSRTTYGDFLPGTVTSTSYVGFPEVRLDLTPLEHLGPLFEWGDGGSAEVIRAGVELATAKSSDELGLPAASPDTSNGVQAVASVHPTSAEAVPEAHPHGTAQLFQCRNHGGVPSVTALMKIIYALEDGLRGQPLSLDDRIQLSKTATTHLLTVIAHESFEVSASGTMLVTVAVDLLLKHYGRVIDHIQNHGHPSDPSPAPTVDILTLAHTCPSNRPSEPMGDHNEARAQLPTATGAGAAGQNPPLADARFRVSSFQLDQEDQIALRVHIMHKELRRCMEIVRLCRTSGSVVGLDSIGLSSNDRIRTTMETETEALIHRLSSAL